MGIVDTILRHFTMINSNWDNATEKSHRQNPSAFYIADLISRPIWKIPDIQEILQGATEAIKDEFIYNNCILPHKQIFDESGHRHEWYLMEGGHWFDKLKLRNAFPNTLKTIETLPILENG